MEAISNTDGAAHKLITQLMSFVTIMVLVVADYSLPLPPGKIG